MSQKDPRFRILKQGYDRFEVDAQLDRFELQLKQMQEKLTTYQNQVESTHQQYEAIRKRYEDLQSQLAIREKAADEISRLALLEANTVIETATCNADIIVREALSTARIVLVELSKVSMETTQVKSDLKERIETLSSLISELELPQVPTIDWLESFKP